MTDTPDTNPEAMERLRDLCHHLRRMSDAAAEAIDADRLSRAANQVQTLSTENAALRAEVERLRGALRAISENTGRSDCTSHSLLVGCQVTAQAALSAPAPRHMSQ